MKTKLLIFLFILFSSAVFAQEYSDAIMKQRQLQKLWDFKDSKAGLMYDVKYYELKLEVDPSVYGISGTITTLFEMKQPSNVVTFDLLNNMIVDSVKYNNQLLSFTHQNHIVSITLPQVINAGQMASLAVSYHGQPQGNGFGAFEQTTHAGSPVIWTLSEPFGAYTWWPCKQTLVDKADSVDIIVTTTLGNRVAANGLLISTEVGSTAITYHWKHRHPIATYLIAIAVTNYEELLLEVPVAGAAPILIQDYYYPEKGSQWIANLQNVVNAMTAFNELFITYPFADEKYGHAQFGWGGGMEHQTMSFMYNNSEMLVVHELAHQWFGDYITCGGWAEIWLNEGFATYCEGLYLEHVHGKNDFKSWRENEINDVTAAPGGSIYCTDTLNVNSIFNNRLSYAKGAMVLHMLRRQIGDIMFFQGIRNYLNDPLLANGFAQTPDLKNHFEQAADTTLTEFFDNWIYEQGYPNYKLLYQNYDQKVWVKVEQTQSHNSVFYYKMKIPIQFKNATRDTIVWFHNTYNNQLFSVDVGFLPTTVVFDPDKEMITKKNTVAIGDIVGVNEITQSQCVVYPNPSINGIVNIESEVKISDIKVYTMSGALILSLKVARKTSQLFLDKGIYLMEIEIQDKSKRIQKVVVQ